LKILVTGGCGYIGSHTVLALAERGFDVVVLDNLRNSSVESIKRVERMSGKTIPVVVGDITDQACLESLFANHHIDSVVHFAGLKSVAESVSNPLEYYDVNVGGTCKLLVAMAKVGCRKIVFSSSATIYGVEATTPYNETMARGTTVHPYGSSKSMIEMILEDLCASSSTWAVVNLRYFNPIGAHASGLIGEDPEGVPNNIMPYIAQVAVGKRKILSIFGDDYPTPDGTCRRDYVHVVDLADGHVKAVDYLENEGCTAFNLGTGSPVSVLELVTSFQKVTGVEIPYEIVGRRHGDLGEFWADASKANVLLNWTAKFSLETMIADTWNWQSANPNGYALT
jgi:UDP-glucose 4-epimerase